MKKEILQKIEELRLIHDNYIDEIKKTVESLNDDDIELLDLLYSILNGMIPFLKKSIKQMRDL